MGCQEIEELIHPYLDGELDLVRSLEIERHMASCAVCSRTHEANRALRLALHNQSLYFAAPKGVQKRILAAVHRAGREKWRPFSSMRRARPYVWASLAACALVFLAILPFLTRPSAEARLSQEIVAAHVRSLMADHLTNVASSDQHTVKPWFNGRLDFSPPVADLAGWGFPLVGGRLDYVENRPAAALIYQRRKHYINLFIWPLPGTSAGPEEAFEQQQGYTVIHWSQAGMTYWAVSDISLVDLREFVRLVRG